MKTLVIGAAILDIIMKIQRLPKSGEDILCSETISMVGGCAYNVAGTLRNFGVEHDLFVPVGQGMYASIISDNLKGLGYDILVKDEEMDNGYCLCLVEEDGERTFITVKGMEGKFKESWFKGISPEDYDMIYLAGYQVCGQSGKVLSVWLQGMRDKTVLFAPGPVITQIEKDVMESICSVNPILHLNEKEALDYTEKDTMESCLKALYELNHNLVIMTMGGSGTACYDGERIRIFKALKADVVDTIGAGDSHAAAMIAGFSMGMDLARCVELANAVAAGIVGIQGPVMSKEEFDRQKLIG